MVILISSAYSPTLFIGSCLNPHESTNLLKFACLLILKPRFLLAFRFTSQLPSAPKALVQELRALGPLGSTELQLQQASLALAAAELGRLMPAPKAAGAAGAKAKAKAEPKAEVKGPPGWSGMGLGMGLVG
jgi:hypothetical protein